MGLRVPVGTLIYRDLDMTVRDDAIEDIRTALIDAGWEELDELNEKFQININSNTLDGTTLTIANGATTTTYTFKNTPTLPEHIQIGANIQATRDNAVALINGYPDPLVTVEAGSITDPSNTSRFVLVNILSGIHNDISVSRVGSNITLESTVWEGGGYSLLSVTTAEHPIRAGIELSSNSTDVRLRMFSRDLEDYSIYYFLDVAARTLKMSVDGQEFETWFPGSSSTAGCTVHMCVPFLFPGQEPMIIASVADNGSGEFRLTFADPHGMTTGQNLFIDAATKNSGDVLSALNGTHQVTVIDSTTLDLDLSVYEANYDADSALAATVKRHARCFFAMGCEAANVNGISFRNNIASWSLSGQSANQTLCLDGVFYEYDVSNINGVANIELYVLKTAQTNVMGKVHGIGVLGAGITPIIGWKMPDANGTNHKIAHLPGALIIEDDIDMDETFTKFGYNWTNLTNNDDRGSLIKIVTEAA